MRIIKFVLSFIATVVLVVGLNQRQFNLPALGIFFSPTAGFWQNAEPVEFSLPASINIDGLSAPVKVVYDDRLVPHIFAENAVDAAMAQGYVTAQHRLWSMEFQIFAGSGRLSEFIGKVGLPADRQTRRRGLIRAAETALEEWKKDTEYFQYIQAYTDGVNAWIDQLKPVDYPLEYKLIGYQPERWSVLKCAILQKVMSRTLSMREDDLEATNALNIFGKEEFDFLYPEWYDEQLPIIPKGTEWNFEKVTVRSDSFPATDKKLSHIPLTKPPEFAGSNNWAVSGKKTASGNPILCSDPHLNITLPSIWFEIQISIPEYNVYGVSIPGSPGVIIGFNENIAWGMTNVGHDVSDWYRIHWQDESRQAYLFDGAYRESEQVIETYKVRNGTTVYDTIYYTHLGPVAYTKEGDIYQDLAFHWLGAYPSNDVKMFFSLNKAKNYEDYVNALGYYTCPAQNFAFASKDGDIALWVQGNFPLKADQQGRFVQEGNTSANEWQGFVPNEQNPHTFNPESGYVSSANQHSTDPSYPYYYNGGFDDYRGRTLHTALSGMESITPDDLKKLQNNNFNLQAKEMTPLLLEKLDKSVLSKDEIGFYNEIKDWDYKHEKGLVAPAVFRSWFSNFYKQTWDEFYTLNDSISVLFPESWRTVYLLRDHEESKWFDITTTDTKETSADIVTQSFKSACQELLDWSQKNDQRPFWRDYKGTIIRHLLRQPALSAVNVDVGGDRNALNAVSKSFGPSWRMVVELGEEIKAWGVYPGGQSGNPGSPFYDDFVNYWAQGEYYDILFMKAPEQGDRVIGIQTLSKN
ncbi:MAG: penicillin acylase family protein [Bacteroidota bacterium]